MTTHLGDISFSSTIRVEARPDRIGEALGHDPRSPYVERFWLPVLGPSTTFLLRYLAARLDTDPDGVDLDVAETARLLGLGEREGRHGPFLRSVARMIDFEMAELAGPGRLLVRRRLPALSRRHLARLPDSWRAEHDAMLEPPPPPADALRRRGERLALSLIELGESLPDCERQLIAWKFHPALAHECARWAARRGMTRVLTAVPARPREDDAHVRDCSREDAVSS
jgi:hypothetical protein